MFIYRGKTPGLAEGLSKFDKSRSGFCPTGWSVIPAWTAGIPLTGMREVAAIHGPWTPAIPAGATIWLLPDGDQTPLRGQPPKATGFAGESARLKNPRKYSVNLRGIQSGARDGLIRRG
jgi:hypothetical protein